MDADNAEKIATELAQEEKEPLVIVDEAVDNIIASVLAIDESLSLVKPENELEKQALEKVKDLMETAIAPYIADVAKALEAFEE